MGLHLENEVAKRVVKTLTIIFNNPVCVCVYIYIYIYIYEFNYIKINKCYIVYSVRCDTAVKIKAN